MLHVSTRSRMLAPPFGFGFAESPLWSEASSAHSTAKINQEFSESIAVGLREALDGALAIERCQKKSDIEVFFFDKIYKNK